MEEAVFIGVADAAAQSHSHLASCYLQLICDLNSPTRVSPFLRSSGFVESFLHAVGMWRARWLNAGVDPPVLVTNAWHL